MLRALALVFASTLGCTSAAPSSPPPHDCRTLEDYAGFLTHDRGAADRELELSIRSVASTSRSRTVDVSIRNVGPRPRWIALEDEDPLARTEPDVSLVWVPDRGDEADDDDACAKAAWPTFAGCGNTVETPLPDRAVLLAPGESRAIGRYDLRTEPSLAGGRLYAFYSLRDGCKPHPGEPPADAAADHPSCRERVWVRSTVGMEMAPR